jgi:hypothetical protein
MDKNLSPSIFGFNFENIPSSSGKIDIEEAVYEFGQVMYKIGRFETDGKDTNKEYNKLLKKFGYENHPMEIEARETEKKWNRKALNYMKKNL